jgi:hypothetical protein
LLINKGQMRGHDEKKLVKPLRISKKNEISSPSSSSFVNNATFLACESAADQKGLWVWKLFEKFWSLWTCAP